MTAKILADFLALLLLRTMLNRWCGSPVKAIEKQNRQTSRSFILSEVIKILCLLCFLVTKKKEKQFFLVSRHVLSLKKNHVRLRTDSVPQYVFLRFSTCYPHVYSRGLTTTTQWGDTILSLSESCLLSNPVVKTATARSTQLVLKHSSDVSFS